MLEFTFVQHPKVAPFSFSLNCPWTVVLLVRVQVMFLLMLVLAFLASTFSDWHIHSSIDDLPRDVNPDTKFISVLLI